jgi:hypothetical protein
MAETDGLRVGDSEREAVAAELREHYAQGRLTIEDFQRRLDAALKARTRGDLSKLISDLPNAKPAGAPLPAPPGSWRQHDRRSGPEFGSGDRGRRRAAVSGVSALLASIAGLLIVFDFMAGLRFPLPGKLGILIAIFTVIRALLRRVFRGGRRFR